MNQVQPWIGHVPLRKLHMGVLQAFIGQRRVDGVKSRTINQALKIVRQIVSFAADELIDEHGLTWLERAPKIKLLPEHDLRWEWELKPQGLEGSASILPAGPFKSRQEGIVLLNRVEQRIVETRRGSRVQGLSA